MRTLRVDIEGLDLVLGGGVPLLKRHESFAGDSATLVVRGPPGSGKTVFGTELASSLARSLKVDVAYACVELLPSELAAQRAGLKRPTFVERVVEPPFPREARTGAECRIYAGVLDLGTPRDEQARLLPAIDELLAAIREAGGKPGVLVVDSLSDGYHLGGSAPRPLADELCKTAVERGLVLILLEETTGGEQSVWCFAADLVIELDIGALPSLEDAGGALLRRARFTKNRFGPCEPGPHRFEVSPRSGVRLYPNTLTYTRPWAVSTLLPGWRADARAWTWGVLSRLDHQTQTAQAGFPFARCVTYLYGQLPGQVAQWALAAGDSGAPGTDVLMSFGAEPTIPEGEFLKTKSLYVVLLGTLLTSDQPVARALGALSRISAMSPIGRVIIGDLRRIRETWSPERVRQTLGTLVDFLKRAAIPVLLVETIRGTWQPYLEIADVEVFVQGVEGANLAQLTLLRLGIGGRLTDPPPQSRIVAELLAYL